MDLEFEAVCDSVKEQAKQIVNAKLSSKEDENASKAIGRELSYLLSELRRLSRDKFQEQDRLFHDIEKVKSKVENKHLQLQNLLYEKAYLLREIHRCRAFDLTETKKIELVSLADFKKSAVPALSQENEPHPLQMNRLAHELTVRKKLLNDLELKKKEKISVQESTTKQKTFISELPSKLDAIETATHGLQEYFGVSLSKRMQRHSYCRQLPNPLYVIYSQLEAYDDAFGGVTMKVEKSTQELQAGKKRAASQDKKSSEKRKKSRSKRSSSPAGSVDDEDSDEDMSEKLDLYRPHHLIVRARLRSKHTADVMLRFELLEPLDVVTVSAEGHQALLANLFPNDTGVFLPRTVAKYEQTQERMTEFPAHLKGRPYKWAQWLAGLTYLDPSMPNHSQPSTREIVENILSRVHAQEALSTQLTDLEKCPHPVPVHKLAEPLFPPTAVTKLVKWEEVSEDAVDFLKFSTPRCVAPVIEMQSGDKSLSPKVDEWSDFGRRLFRGEFETSGKAGCPKRLHVVVQVFVDYPVRAPYFTLFTDVDDKLDETKFHGTQEFRIIQSELNTYAGELRGGDPLNLLSHQLRRLQMCLDVLTGDIDKSSHQSFGRTKRGRDRRLAFVHDPNTHRFKHR